MKFFETFLILLFCQVIKSTRAYKKDENPLKDFFRHSGAAGTQLGRDETDERFYYSMAEIPHLPFVTGFFGTHGTYRFLTANEQVLLAIGEGKHGIWRVHENGMIREYLKKGKIGITDSINPNEDNLDPNTLDIIKHNYAHYIPEEGFAGYKYPDERLSKETSHRNFIDLSIYHPKYGGKYNDHVPIDLSYFYCTLSGPDFPHADNIWKYAMAQPMANRMGPLARRAGMDIKETHLNLIRFNLFPDASVWINIAGNGAIVRNKQDARTKTVPVDFQLLDLEKMDYEVYFVERVFYNKRYIFVALVMDTKPPLNSSFSYIRPNGAYWDQLVARGSSQQLANINKEPNHFPLVPIRDYPTAGSSSNQKTIGLPIYGIHHTDRRKFKLKGGYCPAKGGDFGRYPWGDSGAGFPNNYEEISPVCDGVVMDLKLWANLWDETWRDHQLNLGNAGYPGKYTIEFVGDANLYGKYTDPYMVGKTNPYLMDFTSDGQFVEHTAKKPNPLKLTMNFTRLGKILGYNEADIKSNIDLPQCQAQTTQKPCQDVGPVGAASTGHNGHNADRPFENWEAAVFSLLILSICVNIFAIILFSCLYLAKKENETRVKSV